MTTEKPDYIPEAVWRFYQEMIAPNGTGRPRLLILHKNRVPVERLFGIHPQSIRDRKGVPAIAATRRNLTHNIETGCRFQDCREMDYRLLFDLFWTLPWSYDADAYQALRRARELAPEIARLARELSAALNEYRDIANKRLVPFPHEGLMTDAWLEMSAEMGGEEAGAHFEMYCAPFFGASIHGRVDVKYLPAPDLMIESLSSVFDGFDPTCNDVFADYANSNQYPGLTGIVRALWDLPWHLTAK